MEYTFKSDVTAKDIWKLSMYHIYHSVAGVCNIIFTVAVVLLTIKLRSSLDSWLVGLLAGCCLLFPLVQPLAIYRRAAAQAAALPENMVYLIDDTYLHITTGDQNSYIPWNHIRGIIRERGMIILMADAGRGYMLTDRALGAQKDAFLAFAEEKLKDRKKEQTS